MVKVHFESTEEFEDLFKQKSVKVTDAIVNGIERAMTENKKTALIFLLSFQDVDQAFEVSLPESQWKISLESCLKHYQKLDKQDQQIDTWKLLEILNIEK
jgi:hypothetical protein